MNRGPRGRLGLAITVSTALHAAAIALFWATASRAEPLPEMRVYAVDLVSPPPQQAGEWSPEPAATPDPAPAPEPEPEQPEPEPPAPEPEPAPAPPPKKPEPQTPKPAPEKPKPAPKKAAESKPEAPKQAERGQPSTGRNPDPTSAGGEGLNVQLNGLQCFDPGYCENIIRQVNRYFRSPTGGSGAQADVYFVIRHDGSVEDLRVISNSGGVSFKLAVLEAVEQAGLNRAFGSLPSAFGDQLPVRFTFRPAR